MFAAAERNLIGSNAELEEQLVVEIIVRNLDTSLAFYTGLGFTLQRRDDGFAVLRLGARRVFLDQCTDLPRLHGPSRANVRIITPDVDQIWAKVQALGVPVQRPIAYRTYGLRDFTVSDPDGFELRFASPYSAEPGA